MKNSDHKKAGGKIWGPIVWLREMPEVGPSVKVYIGQRGHKGRRLPLSIPAVLAGRSSTISGSNWRRGGQRTLHGRCSNTCSICTSADGQWAAKMAQERCKKVLMQWNPAMKCLEEESAFNKAAPMWFWRRVCQTGYRPGGGCESQQEANQTRRERTAPQAQACFYIPLPNTPSRQLRGWIQKQPWEVHPLPEIRRTLSPRRKQARTQELTSLMCVVNPKSIVQRTHLMRELPSIKRGITTTVHAGRISQFIQNYMLITQGPWVLQGVQGFQLPLVENPAQWIRSIMINLLNFDQTALVPTQCSSPIAHLCQFLTSKYIYNVPIYTCQ